MSRAIPMRRSRCRYQWYQRYKALSLHVLIAIITASCNPINIDRSQTNGSNDNTPTTSSVVCTIPETLPQNLRDTCLYTEMAFYTINPALVYYKPNFPLWTDDAEKYRWVYLPAAPINTKDPNQWVFPKGTQFFEEFRRKNLKTGQIQRVETRWMAKRTDGTGFDA